MYTLRIYNDDGTQMIRPAKYVRYVPPVKTESEDCSAQLMAFQEDDRKFIIDHARVYVMNENGATVADYTL